MYEFFQFHFLDYEYDVLFQQKKRESLNVFPIVQASAFQCCTDSGEAANHFFLPNSSTRSYLEESHVVPDKHSDISCSVTHSNDGCEGHSRYPIKSETSSTFQRVASHELNSQERDSALSRYKEKKKTRRYHCPPFAHKCMTSQIFEIFSKSVNRISF